jgi:hypothetical protein
VCPRRIRYVSLNYFPFFENVICPSGNVTPKVKSGHLVWQKYASNCGNEISTANSRSHSSRPQKKRINFRRTQC